MAAQKAVNAVQTEPVKQLKLSKKEYLKYIYVL